MKKQYLIIVAVIICALCLAACGTKETPKGSAQTETASKGPQVDSAIIGTWEEADVPEDQKLGDYWTFNSDGTGVYGLMDVEIQFTAEGGNLHFTCDFGEYDYTYSVEGDILTLTEEGSSSNKYQKKN